MSESFAFKLKLKAKMSLRVTYYTFWRTDSCIISYCFYSIVPSFFCMLGVISLKLQNIEEDLHIQDALSVIAQALRQMDEDGKNITAAPNNCHDGTVVWESGPQILE